jgi:hypothetical protein
MGCERFWLSPFSVGGKLTSRRAQSMVEVVVYKGVQHARRDGIMGRNVRSGPFTRDCVVDLRDHAHSDTESMCDSRLTSGIS